MAIDAPILAWDNLLEKSSYTVSYPGGLVSGSAADGDMFNPLILRAPAGTANIVIDMPFTVYTNAYAYGVSGYGVGGYGGYLAGGVSINCLILGGARYDQAGFRSIPTSTTIKFTSPTGVVTQIVRAGQVNYTGSGSEVFLFDPIVAIKVEIIFSGIPDYATFPEIFMGNAVQMPFLDVGFDPTHETTTGQDFLSESGRVYPQVRYRKMELNPSWSYVPESSFVAVQDIIESAFEIKKPVWFAWQPLSRPAETYLMRNNVASTPFPYVNAKYKSLSLALQEAL